MTKTAIALALAMSALTTACGGHGDTTTSTTTTSPPTTVTTAGGTTTGSATGGSISSGTSGGATTGGSTTGATTTGDSTGGTTTGGTTTGGVSSMPPAPLAVSAWGDSLTAGAGTSQIAPDLPYPQQLSALIGRPVANEGVGGQTSSEIVARQGGKPALFSFAGHQLVPGDNLVASYSVPPITIQCGCPITGVIDSIHGTLSLIDGVKGILSFATGSSGPVSDSSPFIPDTDAERDQIQVLWVGRNNFFDPTTVLSDVTAAVNYVRSKRVIVLSVLNEDDPTEFVGAANYKTIIALNKSLSAIPGVTYIDVRAMLVAAYNPAIPQDVIDNANDVTPTSLRADGLHLKVTGYAIVARAVADAIIENGW